MSDSVHLGHKEKYHLNAVNNPAALPGQVDGQEYKYERVETAKVDEDGNATVVDAREDRGKEDPGMNYKDVRPPNVLPGTPLGVVPSSVSGTAPQNPLYDASGPYALTTESVALRGQGDAVPLADSGLIQETTTIKEKKSVHTK